MKKIWGLSLAVLCAAACSPKASIDMTVDGAPETKLAVYRLNVSSSELLDSVKTDKNGRFKYSVPVSKGQPEFVYGHASGVALAGEWRKGYG